MRKSFILFSVLLCISAFGEFDFSDLTKDKICGCPAGQTSCGSSYDFVVDIPDKYAVALGDDKSMQYKTNDDSGMFNRIKIIKQNGIKGIIIPKGVKNLRVQLNTESDADIDSFFLDVTDIEKGTSVVEIASFGPPHGEESILGQSNQGNPCKNGFQYQGFCYKDRQNLWKNSTNATEKANWLGIQCAATTASINQRKTLCNAQGGVYIEWSGHVPGNGVDDGDEYIQFTGQTVNDFAYFIDGFQPGLAQVCYSYTGLGVAHDTTALKAEDQLNDQEIVQKSKEFEKLFSGNFNGDMRVVGNSVLMQKGGGVPGASIENADVEMQYIKIDGSKTNSSSAKIGNIPSDAKLQKAYLFWQAQLYNSGSSNTEATSAQLEQAKWVEIRKDGKGYKNFAATSFNSINLTSQGNKVTVYGAYTDVTSYFQENGLDGTNLNGDYTVANIQSREGKELINGNYGGWSLVTIYESSTEAFRNISLYGGYKAIKPKYDWTSHKAGTQGKYFESSATINISGFITPTTGSVQSKVSVFAGEGDKKYSNDTMTINNKSVGENNPPHDQNNIFDSSLSGFSANPNVSSNSLGVDIDTFNVGKDDSSGPKVIQNNTTSASIIVKSGMGGAKGDNIYVSMIGFSANLFKPNVCYQEQAFDSNGSSILGGSTVVKKGSILNFQVDIKNKNSEPANRVYIEKYFDDNYTEYVKSSLQIKNIGEANFIPKADALTGDTAAYDIANKKIVFYLGSGSASGVGGKINQNEVASFKYSSKLINIPDSKTISNIYKMSYRNDQLGITFSGLPIGQCTDFNSSISVKQAEGFFRVVESGKSWNSKILTKIVNKAESFDILASESNTSWVAAEQLLKSLRIVENDSLNPRTLINTDENITSGKLSKSYFYDRASKKVYFECKGSDLVWKTCSDSFAVAPKDFNISTTPKLKSTDANGIDKYKAGDYFDLTITARTFDDKQARGYTINDLPLTKVSSTGNKGTFSPTKLIFIDGIASYIEKASFSEVGMVKIKVEDSTFADEDKFENGGSYIFSMPNETIGRFYPADFNVTLTTYKLQNMNGGTFTYYADQNKSPEIGAEIIFPTMQIIAVNTNGNKTENYYGAFEKILDINTTLTLPSDFYADTSCMNFKTNGNIFAGGIANPTFTNCGTKTKIIVNSKAGRKSNLFTEPKKLDASGGNVKIKIDAKDTDLADGSDEENITGSSIIFLYGRINPLDGETYTGSVDAPVHFEVFAKTTSGQTLVKESMGGTMPPPSVNDIYWWQNPKHSEKISSNIIGLYTVSNYGNPSNGIQTNTYKNTGTTPRRVKMEIDLNNGKEYLYYNRFGTDSNKSYFYLNFLSSPPTQTSSDVVNNAGKSTRGTSRIGE